MSAIAAGVESTAVGVKTNSSLLGIKDSFSRVGEKISRAQGSSKGTHTFGHVTIDSESGEPEKKKSITCEVYLTCDKGKALKNAIIDALKNASNTFIKNVNLCGTGGQSVQDQINNAQTHASALAVVSAISDINKSFTKHHNDYVKTVAGKMELGNGIECSVSVSAGFMKSGRNILTGNIYAVRPRDKTAFVKWNDDKGKQHDMAVPIAKVCIGGSDAVRGLGSGDSCRVNESTTAPAAGGARKNGKKWGKANGSDSVSDGGICE
jgi:hypothetical protein